MSTIDPNPRTINSILHDKNIAVKVVYIIK